MQLKRQSDPERIIAVFQVKLNFELEDSKTIQTTLNSLSAKALEQQNAWDKHPSPSWPSSIS